MWDTQNKDWVFVKTIELTRIIDKNYTNMLKEKRYKIDLMIKKECKESWRKEKSWIWISQLIFLIKLIN